MDRPYYLSPQLSARIVTLLEEGYSQGMVANQDGVAQSTVSRVLNLYRLTGSYFRRPGQGRHRAKTERDDRFLRLTACRNRFFTGNQVSLKRQEMSIFLAEQQEED